MSNASPTRDNPNPPQQTPREAKGALAGEAAAPASPAAAPKIRGYAPPIVDAVPAPSSAPAVELPRLWLSFWFDGKALHCDGAIQRSSRLERAQLDPSDPTIALGYTYFAKRVIALLESGVVLAPTPAPEPEQAAPKLEPELKTRPDQGTADEVPPTNPNP